MAISNSRSQLILSSAILFCLALALTAYSSRNPRTNSLATAAVDEIQAPIKNVIEGSISWLSEQATSVGELFSIREKYEELLRRNKSLELDRANLLEMEQENIRLRKLLLAGEKIPQKMVAARINGFNQSSWAQTLTIDRGSVDDIEPNLAVIAHEGIVGKVISVSPHTSRVLLLTDLTSGIDALVQSSRARGVVEGSGQHTLDFKYLLSNDEVSVGDRIISSGMDGIFPAGLLIGRVTAVEKDARGLFQEVSATPAVDTGNLEEVLVILKERR